MKKEKGSITLFSMLSILLITATVFALLEGTRYQELQRFAKLQTEVAMESGFAAYNTWLWKNYHLLGVSQEQMIDEMERSSNGKNENGTNFLRMNTQDISIDQYTLLTDGGGTVFIGCVAEYMKDNFVYEVAKEVYSQYESIEYLMYGNQMDITDIGSALEEIESANQARSVSKNKVKSILEMAKKWQETGVLELVIEDISKLSASKIESSTNFLKRTLRTGKNPEQYQNGWQERVLLQQYLLSYMSAYQKEKDNRALSYELEYLLAEGESDLENLNVVAGKLLAIREAANFVYLVSSPEKVAQAESVAALVGGLSLNPLILEVIKIGLLTAWAFAESILDVRALLTGRRISLLKNDTTWTTQLENIGEITKGFPIAKESTRGLSYEDYLGVLLLLEDENTLAMRAMQMQEMTIRKKSSNSFFEIDTLVIQASANMTYSYQPIFPFLSVIDAEKRWKYQVLATESFGYY